jgi:hypothetical protein
MKVEDYLFYRRERQVSLVKNLSLATMLVFDEAGFSGNCFSIAKDMEKEIGK